MIQKEQGTLLVHTTDKKALWSYNILNDGTLEITGYKGFDKDIIVPDKIGRKYVSRIGDECFSAIKKGRRHSQKQAMKEIRSITIPGCVASIGKKAFLYCENLKIVIIQEGLICIEDNAFDHCENLTDVILSDSVTTIGNEAFIFCVSLKTINIPRKVTAIREKTFYACHNLESIIFPCGLNVLEKGAFEYCGQLRSVTLPDTLISIGDRVFSGCKNLQDLAIPINLRSIGDYAFDECEGLADDVGFVIVNGIMFGYYGDSRKVIIPNGVHTIGAYAFFKKQCLERVYIPDSVISIESGAFYGCEQLRGVVIPDTVKNIGSWVFCNCRSLKNIVVPNCITEIKDRVFSGCQNLQHLTVPDGVISIGDQAFFGCQRMASIFIPSSVERIGWAFDKRDNFIIYTPMGSYAEMYAIEHKILFASEGILLLPKEQHKVMATTIDELGLSVRTFNILKRANINTVGDLVRCSEEDLRIIRISGSVLRREIKLSLAELGLRLRR